MHLALLAPILWLSRSTGFASVLKIQVAARCPKSRYGACSIHVLVHGKYLCKIWRANNIPTMQFFTEISRSTQSNSYMLSLTECVWDIQKHALSGTHNALLEFQIIWT